MEERKQSNRIQTSLFNALERKVLVWLAERMPSWVTSDMLTFVGFAGSVIIAAGYILSPLNIHWLWLASFGLVVNWFGDSLDGTLARVRNTQRPLYGFFIDHNIDCINETLMFVGIGMSSLMHLPYALFALVGYLLLSIYVYINAHLKNEFKLTYAGLGPTEFRLFIILINTLYIFIRPLRDIAWEYTIPRFGTIEMQLLDLIALLIALVLFVMYLTNVLRDAKYFSKIDPPKPSKK